MPSSALTCVESSKLFVASLVSCNVFLFLFLLFFFDLTVIQNEFDYFSIRLV